METSKFTNKTNKIEGVINTEEEEILILNGVYIGNLIHDNVIKDSINIYTGSKLTGDKIENYFLSTPSETPWKYSIKILSNVDKVYISYEYTGDTVEAEDINNIQNEIVRTQEALNSEVDRATNAEGVLTNNLNTEINRAKAAENVITNTINTNKPIWDDKYSKAETDNKISAVVTNLDWKESVATYADLVTTYPSPQDGWTVNVKDTDITYRYDGSSWVPISANSIPLATSSVDGKMSKIDKSKLNGVQTGANKYIHPSTHPATIITQDATHRMVSDEQISNWNNAAESIPYVISTGTANTYAVTLTPAPTAYTDGMALCVKINIASTGASTLNVNGLGAKSILDSLGNPITSGGLKAGLPYTLRYNGTNFIVQGKGGGGNLVAADLLEGKNATGDNGQVIGTMNDNAAVSATLISNDQKYTIPEGYHNGLGKIKALITNLVAAVIKAGTTVGGIVGTFTADATATAEDISNGKTAYVNGIKLIGTGSATRRFVTGTTKGIAGTINQSTLGSAGVRADTLVNITGFDFVPAIAYVYLANLQMPVVFSGDRAMWDHSIYLKSENANFIVRNGRLQMPGSPNSIGSDYIYEIYE